MSKVKFTGLQLEQPPQGVAIEWDISRAASKWDSGIRAAGDAAESDATLSILDVIGFDFWTGDGVTAKRVAGALRAIGKRDVTVLLNSPGGDFFEGMAIHSLLAEHPAKVTVKILGLAASAASVIAMAADEIQIARGAFLMIHNSWVVAMGDRNALADAADFLAPFDAAAASIYEARTGIDQKAIAKMMDKETWIGGEAAIDQGFADSLLSADQVAADPAGGQAAGAKAAAQQLDRLLATGGKLPRAARRQLIKQLQGPTGPHHNPESMPGAGRDGMPGAADDAISEGAVAHLSLSLALLKSRQA